MRRLFGIALVAALTGAVPACGSSTSAQGAKEIRQLPADLLPSSVLGLSVQREDMAKTLERGKQPFVDAVGLYSFRRGELLQATLQISRFTDDAEVNDSKFRSQLISRLGSGGRRSLRLGNDNVFLTTGNRQNVAVWFRGAYLFVLNLRQDFEQPRALLRQSLRFQP